MDWEEVNIIQININDYIRGTTGTYGQKYLTKFKEFEGFNATKEGIVVSCGNRNHPHEIKIKQANGKIVSAALDPGTSGWFYLERKTLRRSERLKKC